MAMTPEELRLIEQQLRCPSGQEGIEMGVLMHETNFSMTKECIQQLALEPGDKVLEIGPGSGRHLPFLVEQALGLSYHGFDISNTMVEEARSLYLDIDGDHVSFEKYDGLHIPFASSTVDKVFTVNTVYFWTSPENFIRELARVVKPDGRLALAYGVRDYLEDLPFVGDLFTLYDESSMIQLLEHGDFMDIRMHTYEEEVMSKAGSLGRRRYTVATATAS